MGESLLARKIREAGGYAELIDQIGPRAVVEMTTDWRALARPEQIIPGFAGAANPRTDWRTWFLLAGRGFGKTRTGAQSVDHLVNTGRARSVALIAPTFRAARRLMIEHPVSGLLAISREDNRPVWNKGDAELHWPNGAVGYVFTAEEPDGPRGFNGDLAWCEELGAWKYPNEAWSNLQLGLRIRGPRGDRARAIVTTTPRPLELIKRLLDNPSTVTTGGTTYDNEANLDPAALKEFLDMFEGTRLGRQELLAELLGDTPGALWTLALLDANRVARAPDMLRIVVAVDPATKDTSGAAVDSEFGAEEDSSSETGIVVAGVAKCTCRGEEELHGFILEDASGFYSPGEWAAKVAELYRHYQADRVVAETNQGGALVESNIRTLGDENISYRGVNAAKGKQTRAEPVATLDEKGKIHHVGSHSKLEDQMCTWQPLRSKKSPDRMDARVWAITDLMLGEAPPEFTAPRRHNPRRMETPRRRYG